MTQIDQGLAHHQAGRFQQAEAMYRQILAHAPNHPDALHLLGVLAHQGRRHDTAVELIGKAIEVDPRASIYRNNFGEALRALERFAEAVEAYQRALAIDPDYAEAYNNLGLALFAQGQMDAGACAAEFSSLSESEDFYTLSACRDLLFHIQEHRFTLPQIWRVLDQLKLELIGFEPPGPVTQRRYQEFFGDIAGMTDRPMWERFEQQYPKTFASMYVFWCQKK